MTDHLAALAVGALAHPGRHVRVHTRPNIAVAEETKCSSNTPMGQVMDGVEDTSVKINRHGETRRTLGDVNPEAIIAAPELQRR